MLTIYKGSQTLVNLEVQLALFCSYLTIETLETTGKGVKYVQK